MTDILQHLRDYNLKIEADVPLKEHTSFKIGGKAKYMITPFDEDALAQVLKTAGDNGIRTFILGGGSNILVSDKGFDGIVINMTDGFDKLELKENGMMYAAAGVKLSRMAVFAMNESLTGLEFASGIPGSLGGAVYMNAGAYGGEMKDVVVRTRYMKPDGSIGEFCGDEHCFGYRHSIFSNSDMIVLGSYLQLKSGDSSEIGEVMKDIKQKRVDKQPLNYPSAGSAFKRPEGDFAGRLIEVSGLKGVSVGGAQVSEKHAGFIINKGGATARDVYELIRYVQAEVKRQQGVMLESEIKLIGEF